jgi:hypothetical protein
MKLNDLKQVALGDDITRKAQQYHPTSISTIQVLSIMKVLQGSTLMHQQIKMVLITTSKLFFAHAMPALHGHPKGF